MMCALWDILVPRFVDSVEMIDWLFEFFYNKKKREANPEGGGGECGA